MNRFAVIIAVGPKEKSIVLDTLDSVVRHYPNADLFILDDCTSDDTFPALQKWVSEQTHAKLFRNATPNGFFYLTRSLAYLLQQVVVSSVDYQFVLKIDTDTLFVEGGLDALIMSRFEAEGPGVVGNYKKNAFGEQRDYRRMRYKMMLDRLPIGYARKFKKTRFGKVYYHEILSAALRNGYVYGENVFAACYAYHIDTVRDWERSGFIQTLLDMTPGLVFEDDVLMSMGAKSVGHQLIELEPDYSEQQLCWLEWGCSHLSISVDEVEKRGFIVLHPLKRVPEADKMRQHFAGRV